MSSQPAGNNIEITFEDDGDDDIDDFLAQYELASAGSGKRLDRIPYSTIYEVNDRSKVQIYFIPSEPVRARISKVQLDEESYHLLNPYLYTLELQHGPYTWTVMRTYGDFRSLHRSLQLFRASERLKAPVRRIKIRRQQSRLEYQLTSQTDTRTDEPRNSEYPQHVLKLDECYQTAEYHNRTVEDDEDPAPGPNNSGRPDANRPSVFQDDRAKTLATYALDAFDQARRKPLQAPRRLPPFPLWPERMMNEEDIIDERKKSLEDYLNQMLRVPAYRNHKETAEFLDVSRLSFVHNIGIKAKEGLVKKRPGGRRVFHGWKRYCIEHCAKWGKRWLIVKDTYLTYIEPHSEEIRSVLLYDFELKVEFGAAQTEGVTHGLLITCLSRNLFLRCESHAEAEEWKNAIMDVAQHKGAIWLRHHRFDSFAPERRESYAQWFVDGQAYMEHAAKMMEIAQEEIMITDWWLSPEIYMKRPMLEGNHWRLDEVLKRKAEQGVRIFVLLYKEVEIALGINSGYTKRTLTALHPNIKVLRHPDHIPGGASTYLWAHHEKLIIIDQNIAFVGGIDLCYGRWDDNGHRLTDMGSVEYTTVPQGASKYRMTTGLRQIAQVLPAVVIEDDLPQQRDAGITEVPVPDRPDSDSGSKLNALAFLAQEQQKADAAAEGVDQTDQTPTSSQSSPTKQRWVDMLSKRTQMRKESETSDLSPVEPKRSISAPGHPPDFGLIVQQYKEYVDSGRAAKDKQRSQTPPLGRKKHKDKGEGGGGKARKYMSHWKDAYRRYKTSSKTEDEDIIQYESSWRKLNEDQVDMDVRGSGKFWIGKDYVNFIFKDFTALDMPFHDFIDRSVTPRMPWHDISSVVYGEAARDVARHFVQRWNACKIEKCLDDSDYPLLVPKSYDSVTIPRIFRSMSHGCEVQIVRSVSQWSAGIQHVEDSIQQAYVHMITNAQHYIYIENQFFVSMIGSADVLNKICTALYERILKAHQQNEVFRVYMMLPLLPGFEGDVAATQGSALQAVLHWTYRSISRGPHSLFAKLLAAGVPDPTRFVIICGLRTHDVLNGKPITELVYIHSKLIIVDDRQALIGSANINDRSQLGKRDSEVAIYVEDREFKESVMNEKPYQLGKFAGSLRMHLFKEHLGLLKCQGGGSEEIDVRDPVSDKFYKEVWLRFASRNTAAYEKVFCCLPTDSVKCFADLSPHQMQIPLADLKPPIDAMKELKQIQGNLVLFPTQFLVNSDLQPSFMTKEGLAPIILWT